MVKTVQITMYENELTGKKYKTLEKAKKEELASKNLILLDKLGEEFGFKTTFSFGKPTNPGTKLMNWIDENNYKIFQKSEKILVTKLFTMQQTTFLTNGKFMKQYS